MSIGLYNVDTQHRTVERIRTKAAIIDDGQSWTEELYKLTKTQREREHVASELTPFMCQKLCSNMAHFFTSAFYSNDQHICVCFYLFLYARV